MKTLSRRDFLKLSGVTATGIAATAILAGCGNSTPSDTPVTPTTPDINLDEREGELQVDEGVSTGILPELTAGTGTVFATLTPFRNNNAQHMPVIKRLYDRLVYLDGDFNYSLQAAKSMKVGDDGVTFDFEIYDNIYDSEGNHITADDVVWFVETYMSNGIKPYFKKVKSITKTGDYSFTMVFKQPNIDATSMTFASTFMVSQKAFEASADGFATYVVSTSPYKVTAFEPTNSITMERRDDYWMPAELQGKYYTANIQKITELQITEVSQMQIALETGTTQAHAGMNTTIANAFVNNPDFYTCTSPSNNGNVIFFSGDAHSPLSTSLELRQALCYALDPAGIVTGALAGYGEPMYDVCCRTCSGYVTDWEKDPYFDYNLETAKDLVAKSGYKGEELVFTCTTSTQKMVTIMQAMWQAAGINVKLNIMDLALYNAITPADYDIMMTQTGNGCANLWSQFFDSTAYPYGNRIGFTDTELDKLMNFTWQPNNYTPENITKVRNYLNEKCWGYGVALPLQLNVVNNSTGLVGTVFNTQGMLDFVNCEFKA